MTPYESLKNHINAAEKYRRNCSKCEWLEATRREPQAFLVFADDLERYRKAAADALAEWVKIAASLSTSEIVALFTAHHEETEARKAVRG